MPLHRGAPTVVGVLNVTPDSFSDGGHFVLPVEAVARAGELFKDGADVVEVGGESTRPGAVPVDDREELERVLPVIRGITRSAPHLRIAVDTVKAVVAREALAAGASIVNDVSALRIDPALGEVCAAAGCTVVLMHSRGGVGEMARYTHATYTGDVMDDVCEELLRSVERAVVAGVCREQIVLDPGVGFAKTPEQSLDALADLPKLVKLGFPVMIGVSRKRFIGEITGVQRAEQRDAGTVGANVAALMLGATWFRVHDVRAHRQALNVAQAVRERMAGDGDREGDA